MFHCLWVASWAMLIQTLVMPLWLVFQEDPHCPKENSISHYLLVVILRLWLAMYISYTITTRDYLHTQMQQTHLHIFYQGISKSHSPLISGKKVISVLLKWESEGRGLITSPLTLPTISGSRNWTYPTERIDCLSRLGVNYKLLSATFFFSSFCHMMIWPLSGSQSEIQNK